MTQRTQLHHKLLLEHKALSNKYKLLRAKLDQVADSALKAEELEKRIVEIQSKPYLAFQLALVLVFVFWHPLNMLILLSRRS